MTQRDSTNEIFTSFVDQFTYDVDILETEIAKLSNKDTYNDAVNTLFRVFHNHKALSSYLKIDEIHATVKKAENVLNILREDGHITDEAQIDWLYLLCTQMHIWSDQLELGVVDLSAVNEKIFSTLRLKESKTSINTILVKKHLLYIDEDSKSALKFIPIYEKIFAKVTSIGHVDNLSNILQTHKPDLIFISHSFMNAQTANALQSYENVIPTVALTKNITKRELLKLINQGVHYYINKPIVSTDLKKVLHSLSKTYFSSRMMIISNKKIHHFIESLDPLSETILKIQDVCDDDRTSILDLIKVVKHDAITSGIILSATQSPIYALKNITTIDQAVTIFGKRTVKALTLGGLSSQFSPVNLSMYAMNEATFQAISFLRMRLMSNWFNLVDPTKADTLTIAALLGNIGQMLIAKEVVAQGKEKEFLLSFLKHGVEKTEHDFLRTSSTNVTSDMLYYWKMSPILIDAISYSTDIKDAEDEVKIYAVACHVIFTLISLTEPEIQPVTHAIKELLEENGLALADLTQAIKLTQANKDIT